MQASSEVVLGKEVRVRREQLPGMGDCVLIFRYKDSLERWSQLSVGASRLLVYFLFSELRKDGRIIFDVRAKVRAAETLDRGLARIKILIKELRASGILVRLGMHVYQIDKSFAEVYSKKRES